ncbi:MAG: LacI family transcriptional regulator [Pontibacterium sp.]
MARTTLKTVANALDIAATTVSRALKNDPAIKAETRRRVQEKARELGYIPDRAGVRLRTGKTFVISLVLPVECNMTNHSAKLMSAIAEVLKGTNYHLNTSYWFEGEDPLNVVKYIVETRAADGIIMNNTTPEDPRVKYLLEQKFPFATHGRTVWAEQHPYFDFDNEEFSKVAFQRLYDLGRRNILTILPPSGLSYTRDMEVGTQAASERLSCKTFACPTVNSDSPSDYIEKEVRAMLQQHPDIDAVYSSSPVACMSVIAALESLGKTLGKDIDVLGREAIPFLKMFRKDVLLVTEDVGKAGEFTINAVLQAIEHPERPMMQKLDVPTIDLIH